MDLSESQKRLLTCGNYSNIIEQIKHFDNIQTYFRVLSSTFLLGSFAGIGFLLSSENKNIPYENIIPIIAVTLIGIVALLSLWDLDLVFYERLLVSNIAEAIKLEKKNKWLPQIHYNYIFGQNHDRPTKVLFFYIGSISCLLVTSSIVITYILGNKSKEIQFSVIPITIFLIALISYWINKSTPKIREQLSVLLKDIE